MTDARILAACFERARRHAFYRDYYAGITDPAAAPPTDKSVLLPRLAAFMPGEEERGVYLVRSGGSTSMPLIFPVDIAENLAQRAALAERMLRLGMFGPRSVALNVFGYADLYRTAAIVDDLLERCGATTLPMSAHADYADLAAIARRFRPTHLASTPSKLTLFARFLLDAGERLQIPNLLYAGEVLRGTTLDLLRDAFGTTRIWSLYGGAETGIWAWSDATRSPGRFGILPGIVVEVLAPDADGYGPLAVTNAYRTRFPVFRYRLGDVGRLVEQDGTRQLELKGRDSRSFIYAEETWDVELFAPLAAAAEAFQLQLSFDEAGRDRLDLLLVDGAGACRCEEVAAGLARILRRRTGFAARHVPSDALHQDPVTTKTPPFVDLRH